MNRHNALDNQTAAPERRNAPAPLHLDSVQALLEDSPPDLGRALGRRELLVECLFGGSFVVAAIAMATLAAARPLPVALAAALVTAYFLLARITFHVGAGFTVPTQLALVPMLFVLPPAAVPLLVALGLVASILPDQIRGRARLERSIVALGDSWHAVGPALVFVLWGVGAPRWADWPIYLAAFAAQCAFDLAASTAREWLGRGIPVGLQARVIGSVYLVDALLTPVGFLLARAVADTPYAVLIVAPLAALFVMFSRERARRIRHAIDLSRAYRQAALDLRARLDELHESNEVFRLLVASVKDYAIVMLDPDGRVASWNQGAERIKGYRADEVVGRHVSLFYLPADVNRGAPRRQLEMAATRGSWEEEGWRLRQDGSRFYAHVVTTALRGEEGAMRGFATVTRDVTERRELEAQLEHRALHDALTELPSRALFLDHLRVALDRSRRRRSATAVLFVDLDRFKWVNDSLGHAAGDRVLVEVAKRLAGAVRAGDTVARLGGDEFTVLCEVIPESDSIFIATRILSTLRRPLSVEGQELVLEASVGIAFATGPDADPQSLMRDADAAMYQAKRAGGARYAVFDTGMRSQATERLRVEGALRPAIERGELRVVYQPQVDLRTGTLVGAEALVRWAHGRHLVGPDEFIPLAEKTGLIIPIGAFVFQQACRQAAFCNMSPRGESPLTIAVNLSPVQLAHPAMVETVEGALSDSGADPETLCLEITESMLMADADSAVTVLTSLNALGVRIAIDDFGTGYSSLSYLGQFPVSALKIDGSFIRHLGDDESDSTALVAAVTNMAAGLDLSVVAEWVERGEQAAELRRVGCDFGQGFYFARPGSAEALHRMIRDDRRWPVGQEANGRN
jgi:diguanylate cyclase (GGDEF)-like protein/PAS domain S-box-containing protein